MKQFKSVGVAGGKYETAEKAAGDTYTTRDGELVPTPLIFPDNPFTEEVKNAKHILDFGCGVGRNLSWVMKNTDAHYYGIDPNESMLKWFWNVQDKKYESRVTISTDFIVPIEKYDIVVCTFVFQHIGYRPTPDIMDISDITQEIRKNTKDGCVWIMLEHDAEEFWIDWWFSEQNITPNVYIRNYTKIEELTHRDKFVMSGGKFGHHLIIWKEQK